MTLNVVRSAAPIKGAVAAGRDRLSLEQFIGGVPVPCGIREMLLDAGDFRLERFDPLVQFVDGQRTEVLLDEQGQRILRPAGEEVVLVHFRSVDPDRPQVNKLAVVAWELE